MSWLVIFVEIWYVVALSGLVVTSHPTLALDNTPEPLSASAAVLHPVSAMGKTELAERKAFLDAAVAQAHAEEVAREKEEEKKGNFSSLGPPPTLVPFADWDYYYLTQRNASWSPNPGQKYRPVIVPIGFVTDLASIPRPFWTALPREGRYAYAAIVHDYLYWTQDRSRDEADEILKMAMEDAKASNVIVQVIYNAVHLAGQSAWDSNLRLKKAGEHRVLKLFPTDSNVTWSVWKQRQNVFSDQ